MKHHSKEETKTISVVPPFKDDRQTADEVSQSGIGERLEKRRKDKTGNLSGDERKSYLLRSRQNSKVI